MKIKSSPAHNCAKSPLAKGAALLAALLLATPVQVKADTITNYDLVADSIGDNYVSARSSLSGLGLTLGEIDIYGSDPISGEFTAWDAPNSPTSTDLFFSSKNSANLVTSVNIGTASPIERQFQFSRNIDAVVSGIYVSGNGSNPNVRRRNFRINSLDTPANFKGPSSLTYGNITDGGTYENLPATYDVNSGVYGVGFSGEAAGSLPYSADPDGFVGQVYLSLQRLSDGLYWSGTQWSHLQINHNASTILSRREGNVNITSWSSLDIWPDNANLQSGSYKLRTMAVQRNRRGGNSGPPPKGKLNTITFTISQPTSTYYRFRNRWASSMYMYDGGDFARYNTLQSSVYSQSPRSFEWELLPAPNSTGFLTIKNRATGDILHVENITGVVQCTNVPSFYTSSMWSQTNIAGGYRRYENRKQFGKFFRLGYTDGLVHYDSVPANDTPSHWILEPANSGSNSINSSVSAQSVPSGGAS